VPCKAQGRIFLFRRILVVSFLYSSVLSFINCCAKEINLVEAASFFTWSTPLPYWYPVRLPAACCKKTAFHFDKIPPHSTGKNLSGVEGFFIRQPPWS